MFKLAAVVFAITLGWYLFAFEVYGNQSVSIGYVNAQVKESVVPELTQERIALLRSFAKVSGNDKDPLISTPHYETTSRINPVNSIAASSPASVNSSTPDAKWKSYQRTDQYSGVSEGFASSGWAYQSRALSWPTDIQAALVASCNKEGEKSLYVKMSTTYPFSGSNGGFYRVKGQVGWDSSSPYSAPFTYDARLNALRLQSGLEDSLSMIGDGNKVTIQFPWHNDNQAEFEFSLKGSSNALKQAFDYCMSPGS